MAADPILTFKYIGKYAKRHGDTLKFIFVVPFDLTGGSAFFGIYRHENDSTAVWSQTRTVANTSHFVVADSKTTVTIVIPGGASFPVALIAGHYFYEFQVTDSLGEVTTYLYDALDIIPK